MIEKPDTPKKEGGEKYGTRSEGLVCLGYFESKVIHYLLVNDEQVE